MKRKQKFVPSENPKYTEAECNELAKKYDADYLIKNYQIYPCQVLMIDDMFGEEWKDIDVDGYEGLYMVSNFGRVKSLARDVIGGKGSVRHQDDMIMKQIFNTWGYLQCNACKEGKHKMMQIHRLVAEAFLDNPSNLPQVNHISEDKKNNCVSNLEFCTAKYNVNFGTRTERISKKVVQFDLNGKFVKIWNSTAECGRNGFNSGHVSDCCNRKYAIQWHRHKMDVRNMIYKDYMWAFMKNVMVFEPNKEPYPLTEEGTKFPCMIF